MQHSIVIKHFRGHKSAACSCGTRWTRVGYDSMGSLHGENDMLAHSRRYDATILRQPA